MKYLLYLIELAIRTFRVALLAIASLSMASCSADKLDAKMERLCVKDGGVTIHRRVELASSNYYEGGAVKTHLNHSKMSGENGIAIESIGEIYILERKIDYLEGTSSSCGSMSLGCLKRLESSVFVAGSRELLGKEVTYIRTGGAIWLIHPPSKTCPNPQPRPTIPDAVFLRAAHK